MLDSQIAELKNKVKWYRNQGLGDDNERKKKQRELELKIQESENEHQKNVLEYRATISKIEMIKRNI